VPPDHCRRANHGDAVDMLIRPLLTVLLGTCRALHFQVAGGRHVPGLILSAFVAYIVRA
jgi:hypothetical protein